jgi:hypothetical protein
MNPTNPLPTLAGQTVTAIVNADSNGDGKTSLIEITGAISTLAYKAIVQLQGKNLQELGNEIISRPSPKQITQWVEEFAAANDWMNDDAEELLEDWMRYFAMGAGLVQRTIELRQDVKAA